ncbi:M24 family metallopeptidase [Brevibacillus marinus]|uniref:M24 family metallopeptidase n=1 Tax=Brevibacillus marinus TaxID=2496837 RepID=UPI003B971217
MATPELNFEIAEYQERLRKTKVRMEERGIDVLLVTDPANMCYLTGYDGWSFYVHQLLVVFGDEEQPVWIGRKMDAKAAEYTTWLAPQNIIPYADDYVQSTSKHPMDFVCDFLKEKGRANKTIGLEMDNYYFTAQCYVSLLKGLPNCRFVDATSLVNWVRVIKSDREIALMKRAAKLVEKAMRAGIEKIAAGVRECDVVADIYHAQISGTEEFGGDYPAIVPLMPAGEKTSAPHLTWTDKRYQPGDLVTLELAGCYKRYHSPMSRTVSIGTPSQEVRDLAEVVIEGINAALEAVKPGVTAEEVEAVWRTTIAKYGFVKDSRLGYSIGLNYPPDWGEHTISLRQGDKTVLEPNMTMHMMPGIWLDNHGVEISEAFRVTETGCETLAHFPRQLFVK